MKYKRNYLLLLSLLLVSGCAAGTSSSLDGGKNWSVMDFIVNGTEIENDGSFEGYGWNTYTDYTFGKITLKAGQVNTIRISPNQGCSMNWCYLQINSEVPTVNATQTLIDQAKPN